MSNPDLEKLAERVIKYSIKTGQLLWCNHLCFSVLLYLAIRAVSSRAEGLRASKQTTKTEILLHGLPISPLYHTSHLVPPQSLWGTFSASASLVMIC